MAATPSNMMPLGMEAPAFTLPDTISGRLKSLSELTGEQGTVVMFICLIRIWPVFTVGAWLRQRPKMICL